VASAADAISGGMPLDKTGYINNQRHDDAGSLSTTSRSSYKAKGSAGFKFGLLTPD